MLWLVISSRRYRLPGASSTRLEIVNRGVGILRVIISTALRSISSPAGFDSICMGVEVGALEVALRFEAADIGYVLDVNIFMSP